jgi:hypothetical protein
MINHRDLSALAYGVNDLALLILPLGHPLMRHFIRLPLSLGLAPACPSQQRSATFSGVGDEALVQLRRDAKPVTGERVETRPNRTQESPPLRRQQNTERADDRTPQRLRESACRTVIQDDPSGRHL